MTAGEPVAYPLVERAAAAMRRGAAPVELELALVKARVEATTATSRRRGEPSRLAATAITVALDLLRELAAQRRSAIGRVEAGDRVVVDKEQRR